VSGVFWRMTDVSVVIPTHNRAELVAGAVRSVLEQQGARAVEVVVVDDASSDDTQSVLKQFGDTITIVRSDENIERGAARNLGARIATGDTLAFLDSDDLWEHEKIAVQLAGAPPDAPSVTGIRFVDAQGADTGRTYAPKPASAEDLVTNNYCLGSGSSIMLPRAAFEQVAGYPELRVYQGSEDWMFLVKLLWAGWPIRIVPQPLVRVRVHAGGSTQRPENLERSMWAACQWLEEQRLGPPHLVGTRRSRVAAAIAAAFIADGRWRESGAWAAETLSHGAGATRVRGGLRIARTAAARRTPRKIRRAFGALASLS